MSIIERSPRSTAATALNGDYSARFHATKNPEQLRQEIIQDEALSLGADWLESVKRPIKETEYVALYENGYISSQLDDIYEIFGDWDSFQRASDVAMHKKAEEKEQKDNLLLDVIETEIKHGLLPKELLLDSTSYSLTYCEVNPKEGPRGKIKRTSVNYLSTERAPAAKILQRYAKYRVAEYVLQDRPSEDEVSPDRILNISLGFTLSSKKNLSSYYGSLKNSHSLLLEGDIERASEELDLYEHLYPESRQVHLAELARHAELPPPEYFYKPRTGRVIVLGRTAIEEFSKDRAKNYIEHLNRNRQLAIGRLALRMMPDNTNTKNEVFKLGDALTGKAFKVRPGGREYHKFRSWTEEDYLEYGHWLLSVLEPSNTPLITKVIQNASRLNLGPGEKAIITRFGSIAAYFRKLGFANISTRGAFRDWSFDDHVENIRNIADETGARPTRSLIRERIKEGRREPSPIVIDEFGFTKVLKAAGFEPYQEERTAEECIESGRQFYQENGRLPLKSDFGGNTILGSYTPVYKIYNSIPSFREVLQESLDKYPIDSLSAAA